jgi:hypothetical protein
MDEDETMDEDVGTLSAMGDIDFAQLKSDPMGLIQSVYDRQLAAEAAREKTQRELFERGEENIRARNAGMSQSEKLFAISQALLAPRKYRGISGTIGKLSGAFGDIAEADRKARLAREAELERFRNSYLSGVADRGVTSARTAADLVRTAASLNKPKATSFSPRATVGADMKLRSRYGTEIRTPPEDAIYQLQQYVADPANGEENKMIARQNFDKKFGFGASEIYLEGQ